MDLTETAIRCKEGDRNAFGLLYQATYGSMRKVVLKYAEDPDMADDVLHDGYLLALTSIDSLKDPSKVEGWLAVIMKNLALQELKSRKNRAADDISVLEVADADVNDSVDRRLSMEDLDLIMGDLPDGYGKVFRLSVLDGLSHKEIGERLGIAPNSSSSQLFRAKMMMRRLVMQYSQRLGVILVVAAFIGVAWYLLVKLPPVEDLDVPVRHGMSKGNDNSTSSQRKPPHLALSTQAGQLPDSEDGEAPGADEAYDDEQVTEIPFTSEISHDKSPEDIEDINETEDGYEEQDCIYILNQPKKKKRTGWSLSLACSETFSINNPFRDDFCDNVGLPPLIPPDGNQNIGDSNEGDTSDSETLRRVSRSTPSYSTVHHVPVVIELSLEKRISSRFAIESGLRYTYLRSDFITMYQSLDLKSETRQMIHYLGIPLKLKLRIADFNRFSIYLQGGGAMDVPVYGVNRYIESKGAYIAPFSDKTERIDAPVQWSVEGGLGFQYRIAPHVGLYVEPSLKYYFDTHSGIETIRQDNPLNLAIPVGIRFSW